MTAAATAHDLHFAYGGAPVPALAGVDLEVEEGEVLVLEGPSGEGKSTLLRALCGLVPHFHGGRFSGRVRVGGLDTLAASPGRIGRVAGMVFQDPEAQAVLGAVDRDVAFGLENAGVPAAEIPARVRAALRLAGAEHLAGRSVGSLSGGERQRVALAGVLAPGPRLLLMDEPTSQLDDAGTAALASTLRRLAGEGVAVVVAEHRHERARPLADRVLAVRGGRIADAGAAPGPPEPPRAASPGPVLLRVEDVSAGHPGRPVLRDLSLELAAGTVTALSGPNGCGKSTLLRVMAGLHAPDAGRVLVEGADVTGVPAERRFPAVGMVGQDPGRHLLTERVDQELGYALERRGVPAAERARAVAGALDALGLGGLAERHPLDLSVGQRERVALGAILVARPRVVLLDEPTRGMDPARKEALAALLRDLAADGAAVLVATHDAGFARAVGDRALAMTADGALAEPARDAVVTSPSRARPLSRRPALGGRR
jgi:energy-coupling factor transport system ATP-binding protein